MIIRVNAAIQHQLDHRDRGAATLEAVGMTLVAAILAAGLVLTATGSAPVIGDRFRQAICILTSQGAGSCGRSVTSAADHRPKEPCLVSGSGHTAAVEGTVVVTLGGSEKFLEEKLDDGRTRVTRALGGKVGAGVGAGFNISGTWDDKTYGGAAKAEAGVAATFSGGEVFYADNEAEVKALRAAHQEALTKVAASGSLGGAFLVGAVNLAEGALGLGNHLPVPDETYVEGEVSADAKGQATSVTANAQAGLGGQTVLGTRNGKDGTSTTYLGIAGDLDIGAGAWAGDAKTGEPGYAQANYTLKREAVVEVERDTKDIITAVRVKTAQSGNRDAMASEGASEGPGKHEYSSETVVTLPIVSVDDQAIAQRYLNATGLGPMGGFNGLPQGDKSSLPILNPLDIKDAGKAFGQAAGARGFATEQGWDETKSGTYGATFDAEDVVKAGAGVTVEVINRKSTGLNYWDGVGSMLPKEGCGS